MPPTVALVLWLLFLAALLRFDPARDSGTSLALWVPAAWMFIVASRLPSQWLGGEVQTASQALEEGNALDRGIFAFLILAAFTILLMRSFDWGGFVARNFFLVAFLLFALTSVMWSDFPFVAFKRWFRDLGDYFVILVVLSDPHPVEAVRTLLRRLCYLLIPLSILLVKYFPQIGRQYEFWSGNAMYVGATTGKNLLGVVCLISCLFFFWDTLARWSTRNDRRRTRIIVLNIVFIAMTLWLFNLSNSATSKVCLLLGCLVIVAARMRSIKRHPGILKTLIPAALCIYMILQFGFGINGEIAGMVGRNSNLTGRTDLWKFLLTMPANRMLGTGYESFWLGNRLARVWQAFPGSGINEAHNGYLEVLLSLGLIGLGLLGVFLIASFRSISKKLSHQPGIASFNLACWTILLFYNVTEAAFKTHPMWLIFLVGAISVPERVTDQIRSVPAAVRPGAVESFGPAPLEPTTLGR